MPSLIEENLICPNCGGTDVVVKFDHLYVFASIFNDDLFEFDWSTIGDLNEEDMEITLYCDNCNFKRSVIFNWDQEE